MSKPSFFCASRLPRTNSSGSLKNLLPFNPPYFMQNSAICAVTGTQSASPPSMIALYCLMPALKSYS